ncbi:hypothetical protein U0035_05085 [Niabella yanshanensis]|uniref:Uncharacterized protein n=1 Tax=Niabella yanshanensis TaxID=577386 RepID=A0ABZ0WBP5_9BACT|nr:hypothetical protein [Niabella yanshanensis]WQD39521.1 hypothetical protein U0035_05085 [Niabella yanshanensis]
MKNPLTSMLVFSRKILLPGNKKTAKAPRSLLIEKKWWMGEDLFIDQKPFISNTFKDKRVTS